MRRFPPDARRLAPGVAALILAACATIESAPKADWEDPLPVVHPDSVDTVVLLVGDAGEALPGHSPVVAKLTEEVETWSRMLARDSAVAVIFLGDNVYPSGIHDRWDPRFPEDSMRLHAQVQVVMGEQARRFSTPGYFLAGNHDWGQLQGLEGEERLANQAELLNRFRDRGVLVDLVPDAGDPGPAVLDIGHRARWLALDTHWWLQARVDPREDSVLMAVAEAIRTAGGRDVALAAHHPFVSGGSHGGPTPIWRGFGLLWLLRKTGSLVQDLNSLPYRELRAGLRLVFRTAGTPLLFAGGHDHSLQVARGDSPEEPHWSVVSGAGSKRTDVGPARGMVWGMDRPGFMRLTYMDNGAVYLHVLVTGDEYGICDEEDGQPLDQCIATGLEGFEIGYAAELKPPALRTTAGER